MIMYYRGLTFIAFIIFSTTYGHYYNQDFRRFPESLRKPNALPESKSLEMLYFRGVDDDGDRKPGGEEGYRSETWKATRTPHSSFADILWGFKDPRFVPGSNRPFEDDPKRGRDDDKGYGELKVDGVPFFDNDDYDLKGCDDGVGTGINEFWHPSSNDREGGLRIRDKESPETPDINSEWNAENEPAIKTSYESGEVMGLDEGGLPPSPILEGNDAENDSERSESEEGGDDVSSRDEVEEVEEPLEKYCEDCMEELDDLKMNLFDKTKVIRYMNLTTSRYHALVQDQVIMSCRLPRYLVQKTGEMWTVPWHTGKSSGHETIIGGGHSTKECPVDTDQSDEESENDGQVCTPRLGLYRWAYSDSVFSLEQDLILELSSRHYRPKSSFIKKNWVERFSGWSKSLFEENREALLEVGFKANNTAEQGGIYFCSYFCYHEVNSVPTDDMDKFEEETELNDKVGNVRKKRIKREESKPCLCRHNSAQTIELVIHEEPMYPAIFYVYIENEAKMRHEERHFKSEMSVVVYDGKSGNRKIGCVVGKVFPEIRVILYLNWTSTGKSKVFMDNTLQDLKWTADDTFYITIDVNMDDTFDNAVMTCEWKYLYQKFTPAVNKVSKMLRMMSSPRTVIITANKAPESENEDYLAYEMSPGEALHFTCNGTASPPPYFEWIKNGTLFHIGPSLHITNFALIKRSELACVARNSMGSIMSKKFIIIFNPRPDGSATAPTLAYTIRPEGPLSGIEVHNNITTATPVTTTSEEIVTDSVSWQEYTTAPNEADDDDTGTDVNSYPPLCVDLMENSVQVHAYKSLGFVCENPATTLILFCKSRRFCRCLRSEEIYERCPEPFRMKYGAPKVIAEPDLPTGSDLKVLKHADGSAITDGQKTFTCESNSDCVLHSENARCHQGRCECLSGEPMATFSRCPLNLKREVHLTLGQKLATNGPFIIGMLILGFFTIFGISLMIGQYLKKRITPPVEQPSSVDSISSSSAKSDKLKLHKVPSTTGKYINPTR